MKDRERLVYGEGVRDLGSFLDADEQRVQGEFRMVNAAVNAIESGRVEGGEGDREALFTHLEGVRNEIAVIRHARKTLGLSNTLAVDILKKRYLSLRYRANESFVEGNEVMAESLSRELSVLEGLLLREKATSR